MINLVKGKGLQWIGFLIALAGIFVNMITENSTVTVTMLIIGAIVLIIGLFVSKKSKNGNIKKTV
ncbi:LPXTG cell wall anchor domain protein [Priestia megaterium]|uniref:LPXTG cell wall anchor domain protein n=1 Tax=Priestia megaterium (strain ATCC 14581 / DSM 32 / CCUG 1817 / JCM 2506 / NBRC 15308 / NCIMB 9376 / NCTC 10342 / NRRL B-14308 / VKM B-512 / Ford 19) TaxID=1348623 RepID=A0A0B6A564_PRIM2|nr:LPXTG cell wall anchor domain protein [Priestia megaterium NBRC 15308 = ATCC 14581]KFN09665.1 LPXTG cell wall anchor domain protein [Priestia megaterium]